MFTGIVEEIGIVEKVVKGKMMHLVVRAEEVLRGSKLGDSISVNGVCLTVTNLEKGRVAFDVMRESQETATFKFIKIGDGVNLERALRVDSRLGGHMVSGHIDGMGLIKKKIKQAENVILQVNADKSILGYLVPKGSIAIDGVSLTIIEVQKDYFSVGLIPLTLKSTNLGFKEPKTRVNLEVDMISKYVFRFFENQKDKSKGLTEKNLQDMGFVD
ncbi:MAG: riboflavin synthase [PVC group bacterium]|nr:riboflavin synthase [PVC group bacterium]